jgi:ankyrin repeat protein
MITALVALGARETGGNQAMLNFAGCAVEGAPPSEGEVAAALTSLVSAGCSLTQTDVHGHTPMDWAAQKGNAPVVRALLSLGVVATTKSLACAVAHPDTVRLLLAAGAPVGGLARLTPGGDAVTPLMLAAGKSSLESVQLLLAAGAGVNACNERGYTALMYSVRSKHTDAAPRVVEALLAAGADVAARSNLGNTSLHHLAIYSHARPWAAAVARQLHGVGADGRAVNTAGKTPAQRVPVGAHGDELHRLLVEAAGA